METSINSKEMVAAMAAQAAGPLPSDPDGRAEWSESLNFALETILRAAVDAHERMDFGGRPDWLVHWDDPATNSNKQKIIGRLLGTVKVTNSPRMKIGLLTNFGEGRDWPISQAQDYYREHRSDEGARDWQTGSLDIAGIKEYSSPMMNSKEGVAIIEKVNRNIGATVEIFKEQVEIKPKDKPPIKISEVKYIDIIGTLSDDDHLFESEPREFTRSNDDDDFDDFDDFDVFDDDSEVLERITEFNTLRAEAKKAGYSMDDLKKAMKATKQSPDVCMKDQAACHQVWRRLTLNSDS